jgi:hypothetical protein
MCFRLFETLETAKSQSWKNITRAQIALAKALDEKTEIFGAGLRSQLTAKNIFFRVITQQLIDHIATLSAAKVSDKPRGSRGPPKATITAQNVIHFLAFIVEICGKGITGLRDFLTSDTSGMSVKEYDKVRANLSYDTKTLFHSLQQWAKIVNCFAWHHSVG